MGLVSIICFLSGIFTAIIFFTFSEAKQLSTAYHAYFIHTTPFFPHFFPMLFTSHANFLNFPPPINTNPCSKHDIKNFLHLKY